MVKFSPLISAVTPDKFGFVTNSLIASIATDIGVRSICEKRLSSASPVAAFMSDLCLGKKGLTGIPMQLGHIALTRIPSGSNGFASDLTVPTTPCFEVPYIGAIGKG